MLKLPIDSYLDEIARVLFESGRLVLTAEAGAGKSTRVPWHLAKKLNQKTLVLQPRRIAAQLLAERVASENTLSLGKEVGYHIRYDRRFNDQSKLVFITEALLKKYVQGDPFLENTDLVILDEFHERSIHSDIALMMLKRIQKEIRPELKILVMSASMDSHKVSRYLFDAPVIEVEGRTFPVECHYSKYKLEDSRDIYELGNRLLPVLEEALAVCSKEDILIFLPGSREIQHCQNLFSSQFSKLHFYPLYASLGADGIRQALSPSAHQKIILSTNIAETSLTLSNLGVVIDSGLVKEASVSLPHLIPQLRTVRISQASAKQRMGRAGRIQKGNCFRLWASHDHNFLREYDIPEIMRSDLSEEFPYLYDMGFSGDPLKFPWFEAPPAALVEASMQRLEGLGLVDKTFCLSPVARGALASPLGMRAACFLETLLKLNQSIDRRTLLWATALEEMPLSFRTGDFESSIEKNLKRLVESKIYKRIHDFYKEKVEFSKEVSRIHLEEGICRAFADRICRFRNSKVDQKANRNERLIMNGGRGVRLNFGISKMHLPEYLVSLELRDAETQSKDSFVSWFFPLSKESLNKIFSDEIEIKKWSEETPKGLRFWEAKHLQNLPLEEARVSSGNQDDLRDHLIQKAVADWDAFVSLDLSLEQLWRRLRLYSEEMKIARMPPSVQFLNDGLLSSMDSGLKGPFKDLIALASSEVLKSILVLDLTYQDQQNFKKLFPKEIVLPGGRVRPLDYSSDGKVTLSLRLQDAFEWKAHPCINNGKVPLRLELLSPAGRPIQITEDIIGFWKGSYFQVRKEMRARYPKHKWPEDPLA